jgi:hypothetical protein
LIFEGTVSNLIEPIRGIKIEIRHRSLSVAIENIKGEELITERVDY